jgi:methylmalonyl-CoA mutase cobalamin-binding domain/chain
MKRAVARLENYLDRIEGYTKGTVVLATVFGDVHDIGKSLVNTILTNNGYTVVDLGKQVPIGTIIDAAQEHDATAIGLSALLVSTSKQMPACIQELHQRGLEYPVLIGGAAINNAFGLRALYPNGRESDEIYEPGVFYCKDAFDGLAKMDQIVEPEARQELVVKTRDAAVKLREKPPSPPAADRRHERPLARATDTRSPTRRSGAPGDRRAARRGLPAPRHARALQAPLGRARREGRGVEEAHPRGLPPAPGAHVGVAGPTCSPRRAWLLPGLQRGQRPRRARPRRPLQGARALRHAAPAQGRPHRAVGLLAARRTAASSTSSRSRRSPSATRSPSSWRSSRRTASSPSSSSCTAWASRRPRA